MLYRKNIGIVERALRGLAGAGMIAAGALGGWGSAASWVLALSGATMILTGWIGFCPACAMVGRRYVE